MKLIPTSIPDVVIIEPAVFGDDRGWFMESFNEERFHCELQKLGLPVPRPFIQDNHSCSRKNILRGLHFQLPPHAQGKLVRVVQGRAYDVAVDIRKNSPTFGCSVGVELSADNKKMLWIPEGFAHGFLALEDHTHFLYKTTDFYSKECEAGIRWNDPELAIEWPLGEEPILSEKDSLAPLLRDIEILPHANYIQTELIDLQAVGDQRGSLIALEQGSNLPFNMKRVYYIFDTKAGVSRGFHAHKSLQQLVVCVAGSCRVVLDNGKTRENFWLNTPTKGLFINKMIWRELHDFSEDCVLIVFASEHYNEADYIRDYNCFIENVNDDSVSLQK